MSQKAAQYVHNLLVAKIQQKEKELGQEFDVDLHSDEAAPKPVTRDAGIQTSTSLCPVSPIASKCPVSPIASTSTSTTRLTEETELSTNEDQDAAAEDTTPQKKKRKDNQ